MSTDSFTRAQRREVRRLSGIAYERELGRATEELRSLFERWHRGEIDVFVLSEHIHQFHDGVSRDLYKRYVMGEVEWNVTLAIVRGVIEESEVDAAVLEGLRSVIEMARRMSREDEEA